MEYIFSLSTLRDSENFKQSLQTCIPLGLHIVVLAEVFQVLVILMVSETYTIDENIIKIYN